MKKNKIVISIFVLTCVISAIVGYSLIKRNENHKYDQLAVMLKQEDGSYIRSNMSAFENDDYEFDHAVCNNGSTVTANSNGGVNLKLLGTDKCTLYLRKSKTVTDKILESAKTTKPDFTQISPADYMIGKNFIVNHIYDGYANVEHTIDEDNNSKFTYNEKTKQWEAPIVYDAGYGSAYITFSIKENKENMAICYESGFNGGEISYVSFIKNDQGYYYEIYNRSTCIRLGSLTTDDRLSIAFYGEEEDYNLNKFNFYLVDDYVINNTESGIYTMEDDYGISYYFRGDVENNYVKFGNFYWRIVRLNGDGTLRIAYDGTTPHANGEISTDRALSTSKFNTNSNNNAYVGYMYGDTAGTTHEEVHANTNSSTIKTYLDSWYETNIRDKGLAGYVSDTLFCNDRSVTSGTGIGTTSTNYGAYTRATTNADPILTCPQKNDAFTVDDTEKGNGALTYPIGLLTADEYRLAGGKLWTSTLNSYLNKPGVIWWLGSPYSYGDEFYAFWDGFLNSGYVYTPAAAVPVINLTAEYTNKLKGSGTMDDPYTVR